MNLKKSIRFVSIIFLLFLACIAIYNIFDRDYQNTLPIVESIEKAPDFELSGLNGERVSLNQFKGKAVFVNFWATWCAPCRKEMPLIQEAYDLYKDQNFEVLAINMGESKQEVMEFIDEYEFNFPVLLGDKIVEEDYKIEAYPTSYFIDGEGNIIEKRLGELSEEQLHVYIKSIIK